MYLDTLTISTPVHTIRKLQFHKGLNLIVDSTPSNQRHESTGNNVGKTTVLRLIDFCLGKDAKSLYIDPENNKEINCIVKDFLINKQVFITLVLVDNLDYPTRKVEIVRNFLQRKERVYTINNQQVGSSKEDINEALMNAIFPQVKISKPTFRQIISHNIRYEDIRLSNTLKILSSSTKDDEYATLYLYLFGLNYQDGERHNQLRSQLDKEINYKNRLEKFQTKNAYKAALDVINNEIRKLEDKRSKVIVNPELDKDIQRLDEIKRELHHLLTDVASLKIRKSIIEEAEEDAKQQRFDADLSQLKEIYQQASVYIPKLQKTFEDLVNYHNQMQINRITYITSDLPTINNEINSKNIAIEDLHQQEIELNGKISSSNTMDDMEQLISQTNDLYRRKGNYESIINSITEAETSISSIKKELTLIDSDLFSDKFREQIDEHLAKFNLIFSDFSNRLYKERYAIKCDVVVDRHGNSVYKFAPIDVNFSTGKKQGEISCFDLAYTKYADEEGIPCLHFLLNDKKELVHGNQLNIISDIAYQENIQFVASILKDKLTPEMNKQENFVVELSQDDKLFRIEENDNLLTLHTS